MNYDDVVLTSRIRLARNLSNFKFSSFLSNEKSEELVMYLKDKLGKIDKDFQYIHLPNLKLYEKQYLMEKHLISPDLIDTEKVTGLILSKDNKISIMLNEEDHLRIQVIMKGFLLKESWDIVNNLDDLISRKVDYAFDKKIGYLTCCPTNVGTAMRASAMLHLPALNILGYTNSILNAISNLRISVRGFYGEGSDTIGNIYQISNQVSLGVSEEEIINNIQAIVKKVIEQENIIRNKILKDRTKIEDKVYRSYGIFSNARYISSRESIELLSDIRLGINLGIINEIDINTLNMIMDFIQPGRLQMKFNMEMNKEERNTKRAELIRNTLKNVNKDRS